MYTIVLYYDWSVSILCMYTDPPSSASTSFVHLSSESKFDYVLLLTVTIFMSTIIATVIAVVVTRVVNKKLVCFSCIWGFCLLSMYL